MRVRLQRSVGAAVVAIVLMLACGVAVAAAQTQPSIVGAVVNPSTPPRIEDSLSGTVSVATQNASGVWYAYTPSYYNGELTAVSMADPTNPVITGEGVPGGSGIQLIGSDTVNVFNGIAYVVSKNENGTCSGTVGGVNCDDNTNGNVGNALTLFDVSGGNASSPAYLGSVSDLSTSGTTLFGAYGVTVTNIGGTPYALVAAQGCLQNQPCPIATAGNDLDVIDVGNTSTPTIAGTVANTPGPTGQFVNDLDHPTAVAVSGNYAYVTSFYGKALTVVDISNPANPTVVSMLQGVANFPAPADVAIQGNYAYVINQTGGSGSPGMLTIVDISNPLAPKIVGTLQKIGIAGGYRIRVSGDLAYVAARAVNTMTAVDISNPAAPVEVATLTSQMRLNATTGLDMMNTSGGEYVVSSSPYLFGELNYTYPTYPSYGNTVQTNTGTISAIQLDPISNSVTISSGPSTGGSLYTTSSSANFAFSTSDAVSSVACSLDGSAYAPCTAETSAAYSGLAVGNHLFKVRATDAAGNTSNASYGWTIMAPPSNTAPPTVTGTTLVGDTLTANNGSWAGSSLSYAYKWERCDTHGANCTALHTATQRYPLGVSDVGHTLRVSVKATNVVGSQVATSAQSAVVKVCPSGRNKLAYCARPKMITRPSVTGTMKVGELLLARPGTWSALAGSKYGTPQSASTTAQWMRCNLHGTHCTAIAHATHATYRTTAKDLRRRLRLQVLARNRNGATSAASAASAAIASTGTKITLVLSASTRQRVATNGWVSASVRSNVGAYLDVFAAIRMGKGNPNWVTGTPSESQPGRPLKFKIALTRRQRTQIQAALAGHEKVTATLIGNRFLSPTGQGRLQSTKPQTIRITG